MQDSHVKHILVYGDSNTWGYISGTFDRETFYCERYTDDVRWTGILQKKLGTAFKIIVEGMPGRTIATEDASMPGVNGMQYLLPCLFSQRPLDIVIIMLGTNDMKTSYQLSAETITQHLEDMCDFIIKSNISKKGHSPKIILIAPPLIKAAQLNDDMRNFYLDADDKSNRIAGLFLALANRKQYLFCDASHIIFSSESDGLHLDAAGHSQLAEIVFTKLKQWD